MDQASGIYSQSLALLTDLYQLTMAQGYWKLDLTRRRASFALQFRRNPFGGGYTVTCGLAGVVELVRGFSFSEDDLAYLCTLQGNDGERIFAEGFLAYLSQLTPQVDIDAVEEGTVVFPHEPLVRVTGDLVTCQLLETPLLNMVNFPSLIATKAARVCGAAGDQPVLEFGLRRAQGVDGGVSASRAAYVGGCAGTSNVLAAKLFDIPVKGTHAHSWVMLFEEELEAFRAYAEAMPNNCVFLVDTYDTLRGVRRAVRAAEELRGRGHEMIGLRLDSGDLASLSVEARRILDAAGFGDAKIVASSDLDEHAIARLNEAGAAIDVWGVGTRLATGHDDPALGGVYKLTAVADADGSWQPRVKVSDEPGKTTTPGILQVRRFSEGGRFVADAIYDERIGIEPGGSVVDVADPRRRRAVPPDACGEDLLVGVFRRGQPVYEPPSAEQARARCREQLACLPDEVKRLTDPQPYPTGLEERLSELKARLIAEAQKVAGE